MKHEGKANKAAANIILKSLVAVLVLVALGFLAKLVGNYFGTFVKVLIALWVVFLGFAVYFFRDPDPLQPHEANLVVAPAHGTVDVIGEATEPEFMGGNCQRISIFLSVLDVHVQQAPVSGKVTYLRHNPGQFLNAMKADCGAFNENVLIGFEPIDRPNEKIGVRLIAGLLARRIIPWVAAGDVVPRSERISLIQFGSRCDLYLPRSAKIKIKPGQKVIGGQSIVAAFD